MIFWQFFWIIGVILTIVTNVTIKSKVSYAEWPCFWSINELEQKTRVLLKILVTTCSILAGGTTIGVFVVFFFLISWFFWLTEVIAAIIITGISIIGIVFYVFYVMQLKHFNKQFQYISFAILIVSSIVWAILIYNHSSIVYDNLIS